VVIITFFVFTVVSFAQTPEPESIEIHPYDYEGGSDLPDFFDSLINTTFINIFGSVTATVLSIVNKANIKGVRMLGVLMLIVIGIGAVKWMYGRVTDKHIGELPGSPEVQEDVKLVPIDPVAAIYQKNPFRPAYKTPKQKRR
jgi:hypothetical protein